MSGQLHASAALPPEKQPPVPIGYEDRWAPEPGQDDMEKKKFLPLPGLELWPFDRPARSQSLYRLSYPGSRNNLRAENDSEFCLVDNITYAVPLFSYIS
jgi:hypothetical protein